MHCLYLGAGDLNSDPLAFTVTMFYPPPPRHLLNLSYPFFLQFLYGIFFHFFCSVHSLRTRGQIVFEAFLCLVVSWSQLAEAPEAQLGTPLHNSVFSDDKLVT